jgi:hypothetical protein
MAYNIGSENDRIGYLDTRIEQHEAKFTKGQTWR